MSPPPVQFSAPTRMLVGLGSLATLPRELAALGPGPVAVVADRGVADAGLLARVLALIPSGRCVLCDPVDPDPTVAAAEAASQQAREAGCQSVLLLGGGSALSVGKAVAIRLANPDTIDAYEGRDRAPRRPAPSLAIPTTAGSGSEVSNALVLHDEDRERLVVVRGHGYESDVAILDGELLASLPRAPMLYAALDALSHALEALWARGRSAITDALALSAARRVRETLPQALEARDVIDLQRLLEASAMANLACGSAGLGLVHTLSSATRVKVPHGLQNGILLPHVAAFNRPALSADVLGEVEQLPELYARVGFEARFDEAQLPADAQTAMVAAAIGNPFKDNNRRPANAGQLREILAAAGVPGRERAAAGEGRKR